MISYTEATKEDWILLELLNGWEPIPGFEPPKYFKSEYGYIEFIGSATGPPDKAIAYIGTEYKNKISRPSLHGYGYIETWTIDDDGYLYYTERRQNNG